MWLASGVMLAGGDYIQPKVDVNENRSSYDRASRKLVLAVNNA